MGVGDGGASLMLIRPCAILAYVADTSEKADVPTRHRSKE